MHVKRSSLPSRDGSVGIKWAVSDRGSIGLCKWAGLLDISLPQILPVKYPIGQKNVRGKTEREKRKGVRREKNMKVQMRRGRWRKIRRERDGKE